VFFNNTKLTADFTRKKNEMVLLPNMVQRLFADVISDAIWFMNIHEQNHP
jgi:hypothetical protein